ncbi:MAG: YlbF family regulator [Lachnospiraceae bacterium]|nr:YlbF family regulator [Lachnospiraceae bacterium]
MDETAVKSIEECTQELIRSIQESEEYRRFQKLRALADEDTELRGRLADFRRRVYEVQTSGGTLDNYSEQEQLGRYAAEFRKNELVNEYLKAELHVCREIQKVITELVEAIDLDLDEVV